MHHPLEFIPNPSRKHIFIALLLWTLVLMAVSQVINAPLRTPVAPASIVSFELACTPERAQAIMESWDATVREYATFGLGFDYLFMPSYAFTIALGLLLAAGRHPGAFTKIGAWLGWGMFAAAVFDAIENIGLLNVLLGAANSAWPLLSYWCAVFKFGLILLGIAYALAGWVWPRHK